ncbi:hypothetical protein [Novosphingobium sp. BL-52-GroH]|uniref:hypothetical protein n=1 Tax=Novosphingobium sp. BL-52-GroH TaxID=3349877 RepID=UPI00384C95AD
MSTLTGLPADFIEGEPARLPLSVPQGDRPRSGSDDRPLRCDHQGRGVDANGNEPNYDPSWANGNGAYRAAYLDYLSAELHLKSTDGFRISADNIPDGSFDWSNTPRFSGPGNLPSMKSSIVGDHLGEAARENPRLRIFWAGGYYDLATPFLRPRLTRATLA